MTKRRKAPKRVIPDLEAESAIHIVEYEITDEPNQDPSYKRLPQGVQESIERLHYEAQSKPRQAIPELLDLMKRYPKIPMLYNYLAVAYERIGESDKAESIVLENMRKNPDYLFARLNYAQLCLEKGEYAKIPEIFDHKFDLKLLYPKRKRFHVSEVANFTAFMGIYFLEIGEREIAERYDYIVHQIAPRFPMARRLRRQLYPNIFKRAWKRLRNE